MKKKSTIALFTILILLFSGERFYSQVSDTLGTEEIFSMSLEELMNITIVTAGKKDEKISDIPASVFVITREDIEKLGITCYTELLEHIPGFYKIDDYYWLGSTSFGVRGFFSTGPMNNIIVLVNGVSQMSDKYSDYPDNKINVPIEAIERVEVIKGPMSVIYGPGAFFGAINIITHDPESKTQRGEASVAYGSGNRQKAFFRYSHKSDEFQFTINTSYCSTDGIDAPFTDITTKTGALEYVGLSPDATMEGQNDTERKYFGLSINHKSFFADFTISESLKDVFDGQPNQPRGSELTTKAANAVIGYKKNFGENLKAKLKFGYYSHGHILDYEIFRKEYYEIDGQNTNSYDIELNFNYLFSQKLNVDFGLYRRTVLDLHQISDFVYYGLDYGDGEHGLPSGDTYSTHAAYLQANYSPIPKLKFVGGIRLDHLDDYNIIMSRGVVTEDPADSRDPDEWQNRRVYYRTYKPENNGFTTVSRLAAIYSPVKDHIIKAMWGQATKQPSYTENYRQIPGGYPFLDAAHISTLELNYIYNYKDKFIANVSFFHNRLDKLISTTNIYDQNSGEWDIFSYTSGKMETNGMEAGISWQLNKQLRFKADISYQKSDDKRDGYENITPGYSPELLGYFNLIYSITATKTVSLSARFVDEMETIWRTDTTPEEGWRIGDKVDSYFELDMNFRVKKIFESNLFADLRISNLLDKEIRYPTTTSNSWANKGTLGFGRSLLFTLGYEF